MEKHQLQSGGRPNYLALNSSTCDKITWTLQETKLMIINIVAKSKSLFLTPSFLRLKLPFHPPPSLIMSLIYPRGSNSEHKPGAQNEHQPNAENKGLIW